jgi:Uma2 family endonuclease
MAEPAQRAATYEDLLAVPDLAAWRGERLPAPPETAWIDIAPDWICEVLSPSTERYDRGDKRLIYAQAGVGHVWHVDPVLRKLEVFERRDGKWLLLDVHRDDAEAAEPPFADAAFSQGLLWPFDSPAAEQA